MDTKNKISFDLTTNTAALNSDPDQPSLVEQFLMDYTTCCLCGTELMFTHVTHFVNNSVEEKTCCESCGVKHVAKTYALQ